MDEAKPTFTWKHAAERLDRLARANHRAEMRWLRSLSEEESIAIFEDLCQGIPGTERTDSSDPPPVVLGAIWNRE